MDISTVLVNSPIYTNYFFFLVDDFIIINPVDSSGSSFYSSH